MRIGWPYNGASATPWPIRQFGAATASAAHATTGDGQ